MLVSMTRRASSSSLEVCTMPQICGMSTGSQAYLLRHINAMQVRSDHRDWLFDQYIIERPSFRKIVADALITAAEVANNGSGWQHFFNSWRACSRQRPGPSPPKPCELAMRHVLWLKRLES
jgi:hypothetical protein